MPTALSDSTHGTITHVELIAVRLRDRDGVDGLGYTYTVGTGGAAVHALSARDLAPVVLGAEADRVESIWQRLWWRVHYGGRGGLVSLAVSAVDIALWARTRAAPSARATGSSWTGQAWRRCAPREPRRMAGPVNPAARQLRVAPCASTYSA